MKLLARKHLAAALLAGFGFAALAQTPPPPPPAGAPQRPMMREHRFDPAKMQERVARREAVLKQKLKITPEQEAAWNTWREAMRPPADLQRPDRKELMKLSTPERIDRMRALRNEHMARADRRADATKTFYAALTPDQRKVFDEVSARQWRRHHHHHRHHHGMRG